MDFEKCKKVFEEYVHGYDMNTEEINLKYHHSLTVSELMAELAFQLNLPKEEIVLAKVIGLLHDLGRFEQIKKFNMAFDHKTNMDHAKESCVYLFDQGHIRDFIEDDSYDDIIYSAIFNHNKYSLPKLKGKSLLFSKMIRDMDKVDIYKQLAIHRNFTFDVETISQECLQEFEQKKLVHGNNLKKGNDEIISTLAFLFDFNFNESFDILVSTDNFDLFLSTVEVKENSERLWRKLKEICFDQINQGVDDKK